LTHALLSISISLVTVFSVYAQQTIPHAKPAKFQPQIELVASNLSIPWGMDFFADGSILVTEKSGHLYHIKDGIQTEIKGLPKILVKGQGGLLDLLIYTDEQNQEWVYLSFASPKGEGSGGNTAIMRAKLKDNMLVEHQMLYKGEPNSVSGNHWGSRMVIDSKGFLYFSIGDRFNRDVNPQDIKRDGGKIYRIHADGRIPEDNPFVKTENAKAAIYSYGHRNPQGMAIHPESGEIWIHEHGPKGGDEINRIRKGKNYGWPLITYGVNYDGSPITNQTKAENMEQPLYYWLPSIAPCGMAFVNSKLYPEWNGSLLVGSLKFQYLERLFLKDGRVIGREKLFEKIGRLRNVKQAPKGEIYFAVEGKGIYKILPFQD